MVRVCQQIRNESVEGRELKRLKEKKDKKSGVEEENSSFNKLVEVVNSPTNLNKNS